MVVAKGPVTRKDFVAGRVSLEIEGFDWIYLNGRVLVLQTSGRLARWLQWRGFPVPSPAALGKQYVQVVRSFVGGNGIPWVKFAKGTARSTPSSRAWKPPRMPAFPGASGSGSPGSSSGSSTRRRSTARGQIHQGLHLRTR